MRGGLVGFAMAMVAALAAGPGLAESASATINVGVVVTPKCNLAVNTLLFGAYDPLVDNATSPGDATATLSVVCTKDAAVTVSFDGGRSPADAGGLLRQMQMGGSRLQYQLYQDPDRRTLWGTGDSARRYRGSGMFDGSNQLTVYGRIPPGQVVAAGDYADTVTARVEF